MFSGSQVFKNDVDTMLEATGQGEGDELTITLKMAKQRDAEAAAPTYYRRKLITWTEADGAQMSSLVLEPADASDVVSEQAADSVTVKQRQVLTLAFANYKPGTMTGASPAVIARLMGGGQTDNAVCRLLAGLKGKGMVEQLADRRGWVLTDEGKQAIGERVG